MDSAAAAFRAKKKKSFSVHYKPAQYHPRYKVAPAPPDHFPGGASSW
jgi:hypothetical protein